MYTRRARALGTNIRKGPPGRMGRTTVLGVAGSKYTQTPRGRRGLRQCPCAVANVNLYAGDEDGGRSEPRWRGLLDRLADQGLHGDAVEGRAGRPSYLLDPHTSPEHIARLVVT